MEGFLYVIQDYCEKNNLPVDKILQIKYPIIIDSTKYGFQSFLGRTLISFDVNKIEAILSYQNILWKGESLFASFVEHGVYSYVIHNSPFDNSIRLSKIMQWVEKNRVFIFPDAQNQKEEKGASLEQGKSKKPVTVYHFWPYEEEKLAELYNALILHNKITKNDSFSESFKTYENFPKNGSRYLFESTKNAIISPAFDDSGELF